MPLAFPPVFETARLRVRALREEDLGDLLAVNGDPEVTRYLPYAPWTGPADAQAWFARMRGIEAQGAAVQLVAAQREAGRVIATVLLFRHDAALAQAELGYALAREWWGGGWMREALAPLLDWAMREVGLARIAAHVSSPNVASRKLLARLGFRELPGTPEGDAEGESVALELLARDWAARRA
jgi:ribosomal-protein-alanine N-acetyltransferase